MRRWKRQRGVTVGGLQKGQIIKKEEKGKIKDMRMRKKRRGEVI